MTSLSRPNDSSVTVAVNELYLDSEERYDIYRVKAAERPHLLLSCSDESDTTNDVAIILTDGCDIPKWRNENICSLSVSQREMPLFSMCNVGCCSTLFRRESQLPVIGKHPPSGSSSPWERRRQLLLVEPTSPNTSSRRMEVTYKEALLRGFHHYEQENVPIKILHAATHWKAMSKEDGWTFENLLQRYGELNFRFSDTHGEMMTLKTYAKYISSADGGLYDDSPLAIYDSEFGDDATSQLVQLTQEYSVPECFSPDLFALVDDEDASRPPWRWILIGPERSGTGLHIDPLWTNAWVTVLDGIKRWMLFPPDCPAEEIGMQSIPIPSVIWFRDYYDKVTNVDWPIEWRPVELLQFPGETVFVPNGWAHLVVNLGTKVTVAVTHNYASEFGPFERMWEQVVTDEPLFAQRWYRAMLQKRPDLAQRAKEYHHLHQQEEWTQNIDIE